MDETDGETTAQLASPRLVDDAAAQAGVKDVELGLAHGALEAEQQPIIEMCRVVDAVLVENERVGERTDL